MAIDEKTILKKLAEVKDPELNISIVDLGLIYKIELNDDQLRVLMTLTSYACPLGPMIQDEIKEKLQELGITKIKLDIVFDPPWSLERMSEKGRKLLGI
jgi:metal-sulfur cluster biosynthetic enzyme